MKGFSDREREQITRDLCREGRDLFSQYGLERTRIADLTDAVGIGTSTFYQFFESKEALFLEVLQHEFECINDTITAELRSDDSLEVQIRRSLQIMFTELETNMIYNRLITENEWAALERRLPPETLESHYYHTVIIFEESARRWTQHDAFKTNDPTVVINLFRALAQIVKEKEMLDDVSGNGTYADVRDLLIDVVAAGLVSDD